jgi:hypothetical protein
MIRAICISVIVMIVISILIFSYDSYDFYNSYQNPIKRTAYLLTVDESSKRTFFAKNVLESIGFKVELVKAIPHTNKVLSNKISMMHIYKKIAEGQDEWSYVFEDDINKLDEITLDEIVQYEPISKNFFYLGICKYGKNTVSSTGIRVNHKEVFNVRGNVRGLHAIGLSREGARDLLQFSKKYEEMEYMDMILELYSLEHPANIVRHDLESSVEGHRGIIFQDREMFPTTIG